MTLLLSGMFLHTVLVHRPLCLCDACMPPKQVHLGSAKDTRTTLVSTLTSAMRAPPKVYRVICSFKYIMMWGSAIYRLTAGRRVVTLVFETAGSPILEGVVISEEAPHTTEESFSECEDDDTAQSEFKGNGCCSGFAIDIMPLYFTSSLLNQPATLGVECQFT